MTTRSLIGLVLVAALSIGCATAYADADRAYARALGRASASACAPQPDAPQAGVIDTQEKRSTAVGDACVVAQGGPLSNAVVEAAVAIWLAVGRLF